MNRDEHSIIHGLFGKLADAERTAPPRDPEADRFIQDSVSRQPGAPYYMAQTIIVQEQALEAAQARIQELEERASQQSGGGGLLGGLFGGGQRQAPPPTRPMGAPAAYGQGMDQNGEGRQNASPWGGRSVPAAGGRTGGGFLAGAAQTAVGVAGGMMLGSMLGGMFAGNEAQAAEAGGEDMAADEGGVDDFGGGDDFGGFDEL